MSRCSGLTLKGHVCKKTGDPFCKIHVLSECGICLETIFKNSCGSVKLECGHSFCRSCINTWIIEKNCKSTCPMCRVQILPEELKNATYWGIKNEVLYKVKVYFYPIHKLDSMDNFILKFFFNISKTFSITDQQFQKLMNGFRIINLENVCFHSFKKLLDKRYSFNRFIKRNTYPENPNNLHIFLL